MPYVHLANGDVKKVTQKELDTNHAESGSPRVFRIDGMEHHVVGIYPEEYEHPESEEVLAERAEKEKADRAKYDEWRTRQSQENGEGNDYE